MRTQYAKAAGWAALALLLASAIIYSVRGFADLWFWLPLALAVGLGGWWLSEFRAQALETVRSRRTRQGANAAVFSVAVVAIAVLIQALLAGTNVSADVTKNKTFTLADETVKTVKGLGGKVQVLAFFGEENRAQFEDLLKRVRQINPAQFDFQFVDPNKNPLMAQEYGVRTLGTSVVVAGEQKETFNGIREEDLLNALLKVGSGAKSGRSISCPATRSVPRTTPRPTAPAGSSRGWSPPASWCARSTWPPSPAARCPRTRTPW